MSTLSSGASLAIVSFALSRGLSVAEIEQATGASCSELLNPNARPPESIMPRICSRLAEKYPGEPFALEMARAAPFSYLGGLADGAKFADTLHTAIQVLVNNSRVIAGQLELEFCDDALGTRLISRHPMDDLDNGRSHEVGVGLVARLFRDFLGVDECLKGVTFCHKPNSDVSDYTEFFGVPVEFQAGEMALHIRRETLSTKIDCANLTAFEYVMMHLSVIQNQWPDKDELSPLKRAVADNAQVGIYSAASAAARASMSLRSAQRLASDHGTSVSELIESLRRKRAMTLLSESRNEINAIAALLGYSEERAFRRAFRRWTGQSPSAFRRDRLERSSEK